MCVVTHLTCTAAHFRATCMPRCSVLLCQICWQRHFVCGLNRYTREDLHFIQVCNGLDQCTAALFTAKWMPHSSVQLCQPCWKQPCVSTNTPMKFCSSCNCAPTHPSCTAAPVRAKSISHCSEVLHNVCIKQPCVSHLHLYWSALHTGMQCPIQCTAALCTAICMLHCSVLVLQNNRAQWGLISNTNKIDKSVSVLFKSEGWQMPNFLSQEVKMSFHMSLL